MEAIMGGLSLAGGLAGLFGGGNNAPPPQQVNLSPVTNQLNNQIPQLANFNLGGQNYGQYAGLLQNAVNNPYGGFAQGTTNQFAPLGIGTSLGAIGNAGMLGGEVPGMLGAAGSILNTGFDPQNALYNRTAQQLTDQTNASLANSGIGNTPWGQGVLGNTLSNFNIDWQNNLLGRESTAAGAAGGLIGQAGNTAAGAFNLGMGGVQGGIGAGMSPFNTFGTLGAYPLNLLSGGAQFGQQAAAVPQMGIGDWLNYLQGASGANQVANQSAQLGFNENQMFGSQIGGGLGMLGKGLNLPQSFNLFGGGGGGGGAAVPMNAMGFGIGGV